MSALANETTVRWNIYDLEGLVMEEGKRYEIIGGELTVSSQPHWYHQQVAGRIFARLDDWSLESGLGQASQAPGIIFDPENALAPDVVWVSHERLPQILGEDGKLHGAPELVVEVLSPGQANTRRDRDAKLKIYTVRGVREYWIVDWPSKTLEIYRRDNARLMLVATLLAEDELTSPLLPGLKIAVARLFPAA